MNKWQHPMPKSYITAQFGATAGRKSPHRGTDYASPKTKDLIRAVTAGEVVKIDYSKCLGWYIVQKTNDEGLYVGYAHLNCAKHGTECDGKDHNDGSTCMKNLKVGDKLKINQPVGRQGNSGDCSRGDHVHATIHKTPDPRYAKTFDIEKFIDQKIAAWEKNELQRKKEEEKEKKEVLSKPQKDKQDSSDVVAPEKDKKQSESIFGLLSRFFAQKAKDEVCKCCGKPL